MYFKKIVPVIVAVKMEITVCEKGKNIDTSDLITYLYFYLVYLEE